MLRLFDPVDKRDSAAQWPIVRIWRVWDPPHIVSRFRPAWGGLPPTTGWTCLFKTPIAYMNVYHYALQITRDKSECSGRRSSQHSYGQLEPEHTRKYTQELYQSWGVLQKCLENLWGDVKNPVKRKEHNIVCLITIQYIYIYIYSSSYFYVTLFSFSVVPRSPYSRCEQ